MLDIEGVVLKKILETGDLDNFSRLRLNFFSKLYTPIFKVIYQFYLKKGTVPTFEELDISLREPLLRESFYALRLLQIPEVNTDLAVAALIDKYVQEEALTGISKILNKITYLDAGEVKESIGSLLLDIDSKLNTDETLVYANQLNIFEKPEVSDARKTPSGISNWIDANIGGFFEEDLVLLGGYRGMGKSLVCGNIVVNQYLQGNVGVYFTIEMTSAEIFGRIMSTLAQVPYKNIKLNKLNPVEEYKLVEARAKMFDNAQDLVEEYKDSGDRYLFERNLRHSKHLKHNNQIIIVDDRELTLPSIDLTVQKLKSVHGDKLKVVAVDYLNVVTLGGMSALSDMYEWKDQMLISKGLKDIARKHKVTIVSPYQISEDGAARLSKGILDSCDMALLLKNETTRMTFKCAKSRSSTSEFVTRVGLDLETLTISPEEVVVAEPVEEEEEPKKKGRKKNAKVMAEDL
jgi:hypothetical protein